MIMQNHAEIEYGCQTDNGLGLKEVRRLIAILIQPHCALSRPQSCHTARACETLICIRQPFVCVEMWCMGFSVRISENLSVPGANRGCVEHKPPFPSRLSKSHIILSLRVAREREKSRRCILSCQVRNWTPAADP